METFQVGEWRVKPDLNRVERGEEERRLEPRAMDLLVYFAAHAGDVISKDRLIEDVWPESFVADHALSYSITHLRQVLGDDARQPRYLENIPRRGYRLIAEVKFDERLEEKPGDGTGLEPGHDRRGTVGPVRDRGGRAALRLIRPEPVEEPSPYPGLAPFTEEDSALFFGREAEVDALWQRIRSRELLAVIGPSGAGKTSFLRAGVIPARPGGWGAVYATPGANPALGLARALTAELAGNAEAVDGLLRGLSDLIRNGKPQGMIEAVRRWRFLHGEVLLVIDQFEELFTLNPPETQAEIAALLARLSDEVDAHVLLSIRDDFLVRCCEQSPLSPVLKELTVLLGPKREGLRIALTEPAKSRGFNFEDDALVEEIVSAVEGSRGSLPFLAFAVSRLWDKRDLQRKLLTREAYLEIGGVAGALVQHAEATLERIGAKHLSVVREIFRNLVTSSGTRAVIDRGELLSAFSERPTAEDVLWSLVKARLITTYEVDGKEGKPSHHQVEVVHESLLKAWPRLVRWQAQDEEGAVLRDQLRQAAHLWDEKDRSADLLWTGTAYREFTLWRERYTGSLTSIEEDFARAMEELAKRRKRLVRIATAVGFLLLTAVALVVGISRQQAIDARDQAKAEARRAEANQLLAIAQLRLSDDPTEALAFATASLELSDTEHARIFTLRALSEAPPALELVSDIRDARVPTFSPNGSRLAVAGHSAEVGVWGHDGALLARLPGHETSPNWSNQGRWAGNDLLVTGLPFGTGVRLWAIPGAQPLRLIDFGKPSWWIAGPERLCVTTIEVGPNGGEVQDLRSWILPEGQEERLGRVNEAGLEASVSFFAPDGKSWLYSKGDALFQRPLPVGRGPDNRISRHASEVVSFGYLGDLERFWVRESGGRIQGWSLKGGGLGDPFDIPKPETAPEAIAPESSGRWVWRPPRRDTDVRFWSREALSGSRALTLRRSGTWYGASCSVHPSGDWLVCSTYGLSHLTFWPLPERPTNVVGGYSGLNRPLAFSPDSRWLATSWGDESLRLWPLPGNASREVRQLGGPRTLWRALAFDPAGRYLFAVGAEGHAWVLPVDGSPPRRMEGFTGEQLLDGCAVSPSGRLVAAAPSYGTGEKSLRVWDIETGAARIFTLPEEVSAPAEEAPAARSGYEGGFRYLVFQGESTLYSSGDGGIRRWNLDSGTAELVWEAPPGSTVFMASTADFRNAFVSMILRKDGSDQGEWRIFRVDLATGKAESTAELEDLSRREARFSISGAVYATSSIDGLVGVGEVDGGAPHFLAGHVGVVQYSAVSPDLKWVASTGEDNTLRLWPMPDLSKPPLHTLPHDELIAKLKSLTNLRAVPDPAAENGWKIELDKFPGWKEVPTY